jgi:hypothetical protein
MARPKRNSRVLAQAEQREAGLMTIDPNLMLNEELTLASYSALIQKLRSHVATYNATLSTLDGIAREIEDTEALLRDRSERMLSGVAAKFGKTSNEYGKAGGKLKSERRRSTKKKATEASALQIPAPKSESMIAASSN